MINLRSAGSLVAKKPESESLTPQRPAIYKILLALGDGEMHGYGIMQSLSEKTGGRESILPGTLYACIARMVEDCLIEERDAPEGEESGGPKRRYYRRTALGREAARAESERLRALLEIAVAQNILPGVAES